MAPRRKSVAERKRMSSKSWQVITIWLDADVIAYYRRTGRGWQSRINAALHKAAKLPKEKERRRDRLGKLD